MSRHLRVVQWTTGKTGSAAVRGMVGHPVLELVGCYAYSSEKVGRDVGELCGIDPIGVVGDRRREGAARPRARLRRLHAYRPELRPPRAHPRVGRQRRHHDVHARRLRLRRRAGARAAGRRAARRLVAVLQRHLSRPRPDGRPRRRARCAGASSASRCWSRSTSSSTPTRRCSAPRASTSSPTTPRRRSAARRRAVRSRSRSACWHGRWVSTIDGVGFRGRVRHGEPGHRLRVHDPRQGADRRVPGDLSGDAGRPLGDRVPLRLEARRGHDAELAGRPTAT